MILAPRRRTTSSSSSWDYVYADATDDYGVAVWNDVRQGLVCGPVNTWRAEVQETLDPSGAPAIQQERSCHVR